METKNFKKANWWEDAIIYQIYPRSFKDTSENGNGDLKGIIQNLDYLNNGTEKSLGIDAIWINPFYKSPQIDGGYDIQDYEEIDPMYGTMKDMELLIEEAHKREIRVIIDFVPNHTSDQHEWFLESRSSKNNPKRDWYIWRDPKPDGSLPNNWGSVFGGKAWEWDEKTQQYYFHQFCKEQPDLNLFKKEPREAIYNAMRFWLDKGIDGFRLDAINHIGKHPDWPDQPLKDPKDLLPSETSIYDRQQHFYDNDQDWAHREIFTKFRKIIEEYGKDKLLISEAYVGIGREFKEHSLRELFKYYGNKENPKIHLPFNFSLINIPWNAKVVKYEVDAYDELVRGYGWPNYVFGNHDNPRIGSRVGEEQKKNAALLLLTLRGTPTIYYGDELGLENVEIPESMMKDPNAITYGPEKSRDPSRTPMPWNNSFNGGFCPENVRPWLPLNEDLQYRNVQCLDDNPGSILNFYRKLIWMRKKSPALKYGDYISIEIEVSYINKSVKEGMKCNDFQITKDKEDKEAFGFIRKYENEIYIILINFSDKALKIKNSKINGKIIVSTLKEIKGHFEPLNDNFMFENVNLKPNEGIIIKNL